MDEQNGKQKNGILFKVLTGVFAVALIIFIVWFMGTKKELKGLLAEKETQYTELRAEFDNLMAEHDKIKAENQTLSASLAEKDSIIQVKAKEMEKLLKYKWRYFDVKKKFEELQKIADGYIQQIEELKKANQMLEAENTKIKGEYASEQQKNASLTNLNNELNAKVEEAAILKTCQVDASGVRIKASGKEMIKTKIKKLTDIKVSFSVSANTLAESGSKDTYIRIIRPDNQVLQAEGGDSSFTRMGETLQYSVKQTFNYQNGAMDINAYWKKVDSEDLIPGNYQVEIYVGDNIIGNATFSLQ